MPLVADMSSDFLWKGFDVSRFGLIYAGAQKNLGPSGVTLVVADKAFIARGRTDIPKIFRYTTHAENNSLYNTPPTLAIYLVRNVLAWIQSVGGSRSWSSGTGKRRRCSTGPWIGTRNSTARRWSANPVQ